MRENVSAQDPQRRPKSEVILGVSIHDGIFPQDQQGTLKGTKQDDVPCESIDITPRLISSEKKTKHKDRRETRGTICTCSNGRMRDQCHQQKEGYLPQDRGRGDLSFKSRFVSACHERP